MSYDYFYGQSGELFSYFRIPKALFQDHRFRQLSTDARTLYGILLDRMSLSVKNGWLDEQGRVYIIYTVREVQESLCCAEHKAVKLFRELEDIDLIERKRRGLGRPSLIYVKDFSSGLPKAQVQNIDFTVLLTHIGFEEDRHLARQLDPAWGVDLIIGGHSHTLPEHAVEENGVVIAQAGTGTDQIGRFDIVVDTDNNCIDSYTWRTVPICAETCPRSPAMEQVLHRFTSQVDEKYSHIVGRFRRELTHPERTQETELGNLFADIFTRSLGIDIMLIGSGSIRAEKLGPIVTYGDLIEGFPYDDGVYMFKVTGRQLRQMLHYMLREEAYTGHTEFYQLPSTLRLRYDRAKGDFDYFTYCGKEVGKEIGDDALFTVGLQNYHFKNIESFFNISYDTLCKLQKPRSVATSCQDILMEYFREHEMVDAVVDGRMTILPPTAREGD